MGVTIIAVAAPAFGSDVGGTLALMPTAAVMVLVASGRRVRLRSSIVIGCAVAVTMLVLAVLDRARPDSSRTHIGRFLDDLLSGDAGLVIRRKMRGNLSILTSSAWSLILVAIVLAALVMGWRMRHRLRLMLADDPSLRVFMAGFAVVATLGFALNDSGLAVPAVMLAVAIPWVVATRFTITRRAGR